LVIGLLVRIIEKLLEKLKTLRLKTSYGFFGDFQSWTDAISKSNGYQSEEIVDKIKKTAVRVSRGEVEWERDTVIFDRIEYSIPLLASFLRIFAEGTLRLSILDFGGSLGTSYFQHKSIFSNLRDLKWSIVEQPGLVEFGKKYLQHRRLEFYHTVHECVRHATPSVLLLSSVLPYLEKPYQVLNELLSLHIPWVIIDRTPFLVDGVNDRITIQRVSPEIYDASYPAWFFCEEKLLKYFTAEYDLIEEFNAIGGTEIIYPDRAKAIHKALLLKKISGSKKDG